MVRGSPRLCAACGFSSQQFHGDVFLSRYFDDDVSGGDAWLRRDLTLAECSSDAPWVRAAADDNGNRAGRSMSSLSGMLSNMQTQNSGGGAAPAPAPVMIDAGGGGDAGGDDGGGGAPREEAGFAWTQTSDEVKTSRRR